MSFLGNLVIDNLHKIATPPCPVYERIIRHAYRDPPPFAQAWFGRRYFELARSPQWFANSLVANSALEGYGSTQVWAFSNRVANDRYSEALRNHALDESRHSTMFIRMLDLTFPGLDLSAESRANLDRLQPRLSRTRNPGTQKVPPERQVLDKPALDELTQIHITEIRALVLQFLLRPVLLAYAPSASQHVLAAASDILIRDEARHIRYSAEFFEDAARAGEEEFLVDAFERNTARFNATTLEELERDKVEL